MHPWELYEYDLTEYVKRRKGLSKYNQHRYQELLISAMAPYMTKADRAKIVKEAFKESGGKTETLKEQFERIQKRYENAGTEDVRRNKNSSRR